MFSNLFSKPKKKLSLEHLRYLYQVIAKNTTIRPDNENLIVESLRSIAEIVIWGDQNDPRVFEFFLENDMVQYFKHVLLQNVGPHVNIQLLQTLNILFENISKNTSTWFLLSNNHMNAILTHEFDFSDEEVLAYYISFLKTLSMRLTQHTIHFFKNEHIKSFPLYFRAIRFFNHREAMVRIAVRTLTLNVFRVDDESLRAFIVSDAAPSYFANLVWVIGQQSIKASQLLDTKDHTKRGRMEDLMAEHLDHFHYLNDVLCLGVKELNMVLTETLVSRLMIPLFIHSLTPVGGEAQQILPKLALFLLTHVFYVYDYPPLINVLAATLLVGDPNAAAAQEGDKDQLPGFAPGAGEAVAFTVQQELQFSKPDIFVHDTRTAAPTAAPAAAAAAATETAAAASTDTAAPAPPPSAGVADEPATDAGQAADAAEPGSDRKLYMPCGGLLWDAIQDCLVSEPSDETALPALLLIGNLLANNGVYPRLLQAVDLCQPTADATAGQYQQPLVGRCLNMIETATKPANNIRFVTVTVATKLIKDLCFLPNTGENAGSRCIMTSEHWSRLDDICAVSIRRLSELYQIEVAQGSMAQEMCLDMFEDEHRRMAQPHMGRLLNDESLVFPPAATPMTDIDFDRRLPCGQKEQVRRASQIFLWLRRFALELREEQDTSLPLRTPPNPVQLRDSLNLNNKDLIGCNVISKNSSGQTTSVRRFMMVDPWRCILLEPDSAKLGWGIVRDIADLNYFVVESDAVNTRALKITVNDPPRATKRSYNPAPKFVGRFVFDDHIRCVAARQYLERGRTTLRREKLALLEDLLGISRAVASPFLTPP